MLETGRFDTPLPSSNLTMAEAYTEQFIIHKENIATLLDAYDAYYTEKESYQTAASNLIAYIVEFAEMGDQAAESQTDDEIGELASNFDKFIAKLHDIIGNVNASLKQIDSSSQNSSAISQEVSNEINEVVALTNEVVNAKTEIANTSTTIAEQCNGASENADSVIQISEQGIQVVSDVDNSMKTVVSKEEVSL